MKRLLAALCSLLAIPVAAQNYISEEQIANSDVAAMLRVVDTEPVGACVEKSPPQLRALRTGGQYTIYGCNNSNWEKLVDTEGGGGGGGVSSVFGCLGGACSFIQMRTGIDELDGGAGVIELPNGATLPPTECSTAGHAGRSYVDTSKPTGQQFYICEADGGGPGVPAWVLQGAPLGSTPGYNIVDYGATANDGTDDGTAIRAAYVDACANKGTVIIPEGLFILGSAPAQNYGVQLTAGCSGVRTVGVGRGASIIQGGNGTTSNNRTLFEVVGASNVSFEAFTLDGDYLGDGSDNWGNGIRGDNMDDSYVARMEILRFSNHCWSARPSGFNGDGSERNIVYASSGDRCDQTAFIVFSNTSTYGNARNSGNKFIGVTATGSEVHHGFEVRQSDDTEFVACTASGNAESGFLVEEGSRRVSISASSATGNTQHGLQVWGIDNPTDGTRRNADVVVSGSHFDGNTLHGVLCRNSDGLTIDGSTLSENGGKGYEDDDWGMGDQCTTAPCCSSTILSDTQVLNNGQYGVRIRGEDHRISGNTIVGNSSATPADAAGIMIEDTVGFVQITDNRLEGNLGDGSGQNADISVRSGALDKRFQVSDNAPGFSLLGDDRAHQPSVFVEAGDVQKARGAVQAKALIPDPESLSVGPVLQAQTAGGETEDLFYVILTPLAQQRTGSVFVRVRVKNPLGVGNDATVRWRNGGPFDASTEQTIVGSSTPLYTWLTLSVSIDGPTGINSAQTSTCNAGTCSGGPWDGTGGFDRGTGQNVGTCSSDAQCQDYLVALRAEPNSTVNLDGYIVDTSEGGSVVDTGPVPDCADAGFVQLGNGTCVDPQIHTPTVDTTCAQGGGAGTCNLTTGTTLGTQPICVQDGTNCPPGSGGETNAGVNLGTGRQVYAGKDGVNLEFRTLASTDFDAPVGDEIGINETKFATRTYADGVDTGPVPDCANAGDVQTGDGSCVDPQIHAPTVDTGPVPDCAQPGFVQTGNGSCVDPKIHDATVNTTCADGGGEGVCNLTTGTTVGTEAICSDDGTGCGEANTSSSSGGGLDLILPKLGVDLPFRTLNNNHFAQSGNLISIGDEATYTAAAASDWTFWNQKLRINDGTNVATFGVQNGTETWIFRDQTGLSTAFVIASNTDPAGFTNTNAACWNNGVLVDCGQPPGGGGSSKWGTEAGTPNTLYPLILEDVANDSTGSNWRIQQTGDANFRNVSTTRKTSGQSSLRLKETQSECTSFPGTCEDFTLTMPNGGFSQARDCELVDASSPIPFACVGDGNAHTINTSAQTECGDGQALLGNATTTCVVPLTGNKTTGASNGGGLPIYTGNVADVLQFNSVLAADFTSGGNVIAIQETKWATRTYADGVDTGPVPDCATAGHVQTGDGSCVDPQIHTPTVDTGPVPDCATAGHVQTGDGSCVDPQIHTPTVDTRCDGTGGAAACNLTTGTQLNSADICTYDGTTATNCPPSSGASVEAFWRFQTSTVMDDPGSRNFRVNATFGTAPGSYQAVTSIAVSDIDNTQLDRTAILQAIEPGDQLFIQGAGGVDQSYLFEVTSTSDNLSWFEFGVEWLEDGSLTPAAFTSNQAASWIILFSGTGATYNQIIQDEGVDLDQRYRLNFTGNNVTCTDDAGNNRTNCAVGGLTSAGPHLEEGPPGVVTVEPHVITHSDGWSIREPDDTDNALYSIQLGDTATTLKRVYCHTVGVGTSLGIQIEIRPENAPNATGTNALNATLTCNATVGASTVSFNSSAVPANSRLMLMVPNPPGGTPTAVNIDVTFTKDDI